MNRKIVAGLIGFTLLFAESSCAEEGEKPKPTPTTQHTNDRGMPIEKPVPTGCVGKIIDRIVEVDGTVKIKYYTDAKCSKTKESVISEHEDLNSRCWEGYFPQCLTWWETEPPGIRMPSDPGSPQN